jgi:methylthioribose-1-phosphate isomerase
LKTLILEGKQQAGDRKQSMGKDIRTVFWENAAVVMIDQKALPVAERYITCTDYREVIAAIDDLTVRGAPAIGVAAALGIALGALRIEAETPEAFRDAFGSICRQFAASRPTARNLFWAIERMQRRLATLLSLPPGEEPAAFKDASGISFAEPLTGGPRRRSPRETGGDRFRTLREALIAEAMAITDQDVEINRRLGGQGSELIPPGARILTHCNAGALATAGYGTALGVVRAAHRAGKGIHVYVDETRPVLQGSRLTAWELMREGIPCTLITDNMAGFLMQLGKVELVIVGADRIAANGDTANKIGTYSLAVLARAHGIPLYVAAPLSTIDPSLPDGGAIPIEERDPGEVAALRGVPTAPAGVPVWNPAFDVTPHGLIAAIVTEAGILRPPFAGSIAAACAGA